MPDPDRLTRESAPNRARESSQRRRASRESSQRRRRIHPALKHGGYSGMSLLPGEDPAEFEKLHNDLIAEYGPIGQHEHEIIETMARLVWRKRCLWTYGLAEFARKRYSEIELEKENAVLSDDEEIEQIKAQNTEAEREYADLLEKLWRHPKERERRAQKQIEEDQVRREWALSRSS